MRMDVDSEAGVAATRRAGLELEVPAVQLHGVVVVHRALVLEAANALEIGRGGPPGGYGMARGAGEASVVARQKPVQDALRVRERVGLG